MKIFTNSVINVSLSCEPYIYVVFRWLPCPSVFSFVILLLYLGLVVVVLSFESILTFPSLVYPIVIYIYMSMKA